MKIWLAIAAMSLMSGPAAFAQTTECTPNNPMMPSAGVTCHSLGGEVSGGGRNTPSDLKVCAGGGFGALASGCTPGQIKVAKQIDADQRSIGGLIAGGHCDEALKYALKNGELDLAEKVSSICRNIATTPAKP